MSIEQFEQYTTAKTEYKSAYLNFRLTRNPITKHELEITKRLIYKLVVSVDENVVLRWESEVDKFLEKFDE